MKPTAIPALLLVLALGATACDHREPGAGPGSSTTVAPVQEAGEQWSFALPGLDNLPLTAVADHDRPNILHVAAKGGGVVIIDHTDRNPREVGRITSAHLQDLDAMHLVQDGDTLVVALGNFFGDGSRAGLAIIDVADPTDPSVLGLWTSEAVLHGAADVVVDGSTAYLAMMENGIGVLDLADPTTPALIATLQPDPDFPDPNPNAIAHPNARGLAIVDDLLYVANDAGGLRTIDMGDPAAPVEIGRYINPDARTQQAYNDVIVDGDLAYASLDYCGFEVIDVTDAAAMTQVAWLDPWDCNSLNNIWFNSPGHTNELHLDRAAGLIYASAGGAELVTINVSDPSAPELVGALGTRENGRGVYGLGADADTIYLTYIVAVVPFPGRWAGITAVRLS